jgi:hypothetical protein
MKKSMIVLLFVVAGTFLRGNALAIETFIPHITGGSADWTDYLQVNNNTPFAANFTLSLYSNGEQVYSQILSVGALSRSQIALKALNSNAETGIITYTEPGLVFRVSYSSLAGGIAEFRTIDVLGSNVGYYFSDFTNFVQWKGSAIANMGTTPVQVTLYAIGGSSGGGGGAILGTHTETINPRKKIVGIHSGWFDVGLSQIQSIVAVTSSSSLCGITISGDMALSSLLFTPAIPVANFNPTIYSQADLTGTWDVHVLKAGSGDLWMRGIAAVDSSGFVTFSFLDSSGNIFLPPANSIRWTINARGEISGSGINEADQVHMTMTSNRNFIVGTGTDASGKQLRIMQKMVTGTVYSNTDVQGKSFVYHQLGVGEAAYAGWEHGTVTTDAAGLMTITSAYDPSGPLTTGATGITLSVDGSGVVTMSPGKDTFRGFLSDDKKTIVGTQSSPGGSVLSLVIFQITGQTYTAGPTPAGTRAGHVLAVGASPAPFWSHFTVTSISDGVMTFSDWVSSNPLITVSPNRTGSLTASGTLTIAEIPSYHGQVSDDGKFTVGTQTGGTNPNFVYSLTVNTK